MRSRALGLLAASALVVGGVVAMAGPAVAAETIHCGESITHSLQAANDIGPCDGDGLIIEKGNVILDLNGHTVQGSNTTNNTANEQVGVHFMRATHSTVKNGTVYNFDAGVAIDGGGRNIVSGITAHDNIAHVLLTGGVDPTNPVATPCNFGDGITTDNSNGNQIIRNKAIHNGPFSGIALVDASGSNLLTGNQVADNNVANLLPDDIHNPPNPDGSPGDQNGPCGPFGANGAGEGRLHQDIGIRIEGPGATNNTLTRNQATGNQLNGISIHGYVCHTFPDGPALGSDNTGNTVQSNIVSGNGFADVARGELLDGIGVLNQGPLGTVTCASSGNTIRANQSTGNAEDGIYVSPTGDNSKPSNNRIDQNRVANNGRDGIHLDGPFTVCPLGKPSDPNTGDCLNPSDREPRNGANNNTLFSNNGHDNGRRDGFDGNTPTCDHNRWTANMFGTVSLACVKAGGGTGTVIPVSP